MATRDLVALGLAAATIAVLLTTRKAEAAPTPTPTPKPQPDPIPNPTGEIVVTNPGDYAQRGDMVQVQSGNILPNEVLAALPPPPGGAAGVDVVWIVVQTPTMSPGSTITGQLVSYAWTRPATGEQGIQPVQPPVQLPPFDSNHVARVTRPNPDGSLRPVARRA